MDKLFRKSWFIKIISIILAIMLYAHVSSLTDKSTGDGVFPVKKGQETSKVTEDLTAKYNADKYVLQGMPSTVQISLTGPSELIRKANLITLRKAFIDLTGKGPGTYKAKIQTEGFPSELEVNPVPSTVTVLIQKKVTDSFPVSIDLLNQPDVPDGYKLDTPKIDPKTVSVTGGKKDVDTIAFIKGIVDLKGMTGAISQQVTLNAYDKNGNQLNVNIKPNVVKVDIPLISPSKDVPVSVKPTGDLPDGKAVDSINIGSKTVKVYGKSDVLNGIKKIDDIELPLGDIDKTTTVELDVPVPKDAEKVEPDKIKVTVNVSDATTRLIKDVPITINDSTGKNRTVSFIDPKTRSVDVTLTGADSVLGKVKQTDIQAVIDISKLSTGEQTVPIKVTVPEFLKSDLSTAKAKIKISS